MRNASRALVVGATLIANACGTRSAANDVVPPDAAADAVTIDVPECVLDGGMYSCFDAAHVACPKTGMETGLRIGACDAGEEACMGCDENAGFTCGCSRSDDGGFIWICGGTGYACR